MYSNAERAEEGLCGWQCCQNLSRTANNWMLFCDVNSACKIRDTRIYVRSERPVSACTRQTGTGGAWSLWQLGHPEILPKWETSEIPQPPSACRRRLAALNMFVWHGRPSVGLGRPISHDLARLTDGIAASLRQFHVSSTRCDEERHRKPVDSTETEDRNPSDRAGVRYTCMFFQILLQAWAAPWQDPACFP